MILRKGKDNERSLNLIAKIEEILSTPIVGFAPIEGFEEYHWEIPRGIFTVAISFGIPLLKGVLTTINDRPSLLYKHHYQAINRAIDTKSMEVASYLEKMGYIAIPIPASQIVDWERYQGHLSHILIGERAGLGWIGKSGLLIHPIFGPRVRYGTILTNLTMNLTPKKPLNSKCGDCDICIKSCPCNAISDNGVDIGRCLEQLKVFSKKRGIGQYICGICVKVCPVGKG